MGRRGNTRSSQRRVSESLVLSLLQPNLGCHKQKDPRQRLAERCRVEHVGFSQCVCVSKCVTFSIVPSYIIYSMDNIKVILKNKPTFFTFIKFAVASHMHLCKLQYYPQGSDLHVTLGRWNILFIPPRL